LNLLFRINSRLEKGKRKNTIKMLPQAGGYAAFGGYGGKLDDARGLK